MARTDTWGRNRELFGVRLDQEDGVQGPLTEADYYLAAGRTIRRQVRRGYDVEVVASVHGLPLAEGVFALSYARSSPALILRALFENWSWTRIKQNLDQPIESGATKPLQP